MDFSRSYSVDSGHVGSSTSSGTPSTAASTPDLSSKAKPSPCVLLTPHARVVRLLDAVDSHAGHRPHPLFTEMEALVYNKQLGDHEWIEVAR